MDDLGYIEVISIEDTLPFKVAVSWTFIHFLIGGISTPLKNRKVSWDDEIPDIWENQTCFPTTN